MSQDRGDLCQHFRAFYNPHNQWISWSPLLVFWGCHTFWELHIIQFGYFCTDYRVPPPDFAPPIDRLTSVVTPVTLASRDVTPVLRFLHFLPSVFEFPFLLSGSFLPVTNQFYTGHRSIPRTLFPCSLGTLFARSIGTLFARSLGSRSLKSGYSFICDHQIN